MTRTDPDNIASVIPAFEEAGCRVEASGGGSGSGGHLELEAPRRLRRVKSILTMPYPGFPTDAQAPLMAMTCTASGTSLFVETIFDSRYRHVDELTRLGARIKVEGRVAVVEGFPSCPELRWNVPISAAARLWSSPPWRRRGKRRSASSAIWTGGMRGWRPTYPVWERLSAVSGDENVHPG